MDDLIIKILQHVAHILGHMKDLEVDEFKLSAGENFSFNCRHVKDDTKHAENTPANE